MVTRKTFFAGEQTYGALLGSTENEDFERLSDDFYVDLDGTSLSAGFHHTCALEMRSNYDYGGALR